MPLIKERIKKDIVDQLYWDNRVDASDVHVDVLEEGKIKLTGTVPTYTARLAAAEDTRAVSGVTSVENDIVVKYSPFVTRPTDTKIRNDIENLLDLDPDIDSLDISISVEDGFVIFEGTVDRYWKKMKAEDMAGNIAGVRGIKNKLAITPTEDFKDRQIADEIMSALGRHAEVDISTINVEVENGIVTLSGTVPSWSARRIVRDTARFTAGVIDIRDNLLVRPSRTEES